MLAAVLAGFVLAAVAPWVHRLAPGRSGWILALLPLALTATFVGHLPSLAAGETFRSVTPWIPSMGVDLSFHLDGLSLLFALLITGIGTLVVVYAGGYLAGHPEQGRFYAYILLFMGSMLGVVLADNAVVLFVFWELTSLTSFLLIGFDHEREAARRAALQALVITGAGGLAFLAGLLLLGEVYGTLEISAMVAQGREPLLASPAFLPILILLLAGAFTKSAQFPFHIWLPNAMEAPTPVSTYLHAATMVKAGIYLLARTSPLLSGTAAWFWLNVGVGGATMLLGAVLAMFQSDLKRILAYSTVSALGTLTLLLGIGTGAAATAATVYLLVHGLYKGGLFLTAGAVDHGAGTRDVGALGGLRSRMPLTAAAAVLGALSMAGLPPFFGFVGKEAIYASVLHAGHAPGWLAGAALAANTLFVAIALVVGIRPFFGRAGEAASHAHEVSLPLWSCPLVLGVLGLAAGVGGSGVGHALIGSAASAVLGRPVETHLGLWHGWNPVLALSLATFALGFAVYAGRETVGRAVRALDRWLRPLGPERAYGGSLAGLDWLARAQTRLLQSGYLNRYLMAVLIATLTLVGATLLFKTRLSWPDQVLDVRFYELVLAVMMLVAAVAAVRSTSRLGTVIALGVVGYGVGLLFLFFGAPDLAMTQFMVETLTVILFVLVFSRLPNVTPLGRSAGSRLRDAVLALGTGALMTVLVLTAVKVQWNPSIATYFAENSWVRAKGRNIVNVILVDFRGFDTLGEITVLSVAAIGVFGLLRLGARGEGGKG